MKFNIASIVMIAVSGKRLAMTDVGDGLEMAYQHPVDRWAQNKIDDLFKDHFNTVPRGDSEWVSSGPQAFKVPGAVPSVSY